MPTYELAAPKTPIAETVVTPVVPVTQPTLPSAYVPKQDRN